jgi:hypothetical protein
MQQLTTLPVICANTALIALKLSGNNLKCIPVEFGRCSLLTSLEFDDSSEWLWPPPPVMVAGPAAFVRATGMLASALTSGNLVLNGIGMLVLPPPLLDRISFRQLMAIDFGSNSITALPLGIFMWLMQLESLSLDRNNIATFPFCIFLRSHVVVHNSIPPPPLAISHANLNAFPFARPLKISCQHNPLTDPFLRMASGDAAGNSVLH